MRLLASSNVKKVKDVEDNRKEYGKPGVMLVCPRLWPPQSKTRQETNNMKDDFSKSSTSMSGSRSTKGSQAVLAVCHSEQDSTDELLFDTVAYNIAKKLETFPRRGKLLVGIVEGQNLRKTSEDGKYESLLEAPPRVHIVAKFGL